MKTIPEIVHEFVTLYVPPVHQGAAERTMLLIVEAAKADAELAVVTAMDEAAGVASQTEPAPDPNGCVPHEP